MTKNQIIENLFTGKNFNDCLKKMEPEHLRDDLRQEVILVICELGEDKLQKLYSDGALEYYTVRIILNMLRLNRYSFFRRKYRTQYERLTATQTEEAQDAFEIEERELRESVEDMAIEEIDKLYWYNRGLIELYMQFGNYRAIERETRIPFGSCYKTIKKSLNEIKLKVS